MKTIIEMAKECDLIAGNAEHGIYVMALQRFAELVRADERERFRIDDLEMLLQVRAEQIVSLQDEIRNLTGEE